MERSSEGTGNVIKNLLRPHTGRLEQSMCNTYINQKHFSKEIPSTTVLLGSLNNKSESENVELKRLQLHA